MLLGAACFNAILRTTLCSFSALARRDDGDLHSFGALTATVQAQIQKGPALVGLKVEGSGASLAEGIGLAGP